MEPPINQEVNTALQPQLLELKESIKQQSSSLGNICSQNYSDNIDRFAECIQSGYDKLVKEQALTYFRLDYVERKFNECLNAGNTHSSCVEQPIQMGR